MLLAKPPEEGRPDHIVVSDGEDAVLDEHGDREPFHVGHLDASRPGARHHVDRTSHEPDPGRETGSSSSIVSDSSIVHIAMTRHPSRPHTRYIAF